MIKVVGFLPTFVCDVAVKDVLFRGFMFSVCKSKYFKIN